MIDASSPAGRPALAGPDVPDRPAVDIVVPFLGPREELLGLRARLAALRLRAADSVLVVDNTPGAGDAEPGPVPVLRAAERQTPGYARNRGAAQGRAPWIVFLDADTEPAPDLLDRYFESLPAGGTALLAGGVCDEPVQAGAPPAARYAHLRGAMSQGDTFAFGAWGYPKSANVACRRSAFEAIGGFREDIRAAEDADLTYRLRDAGLGVERREAAAVVHLSRPTIRGLLRQKATWGAGGAWLARTYPGSVPLAGSRGLAWWAVRETIRGLYQAARRRDRDGAILAVLHPLDALAWQFGRSRSNLR
ncbi:MAG TPA: glycosyltransferase family 2 protein [Solirubrobacteraceae bacterium]|nr:glycosyltransferase family 2 protein [Solirubrobacteraceae bacterium]